MAVSASLVSDGVARYAARLHQAAGCGHHVVSPLGAWLLLALAGPASRGGDREALTEVLGCDVDVAAGTAAELLADPHPVVGSAAAAWTATSYHGSEELRRWLAGLPSAVSTGELPDKAGLDAWAREHTFGLIDKFPVDPDDAVPVLMLATALATKVSWVSPFDLAPGSALGAGSPWAGRLQRVLRTPGGRGHEQFIAMTPDAGDVIVHAADAVGGLLVVSVGAVPEVPAGRVLAVAHDMGCRLAVGAAVERRDLASLPLGDGPLWRLWEVNALDDSCTAVLPAWSASSSLSLGDPMLGFRAAVRGIVPGPWDVRQAAMARYSRTGFEAAAITPMFAGMAFQAPRPRRAAELRFGHPYAVVAVATDPAADWWHRQAGSGPWHGLPVFSAWVSEPEDAAADDAAADDAAANDTEPEDAQPDDQPPAGTPV